MQEIISAIDIGKSGIILDINPKELPLEAISNGNNVRSTVSGMASFGGYESLSTPPVNITAGHITHNHANDSVKKQLIIAGINAIYMYDTLWTDLTSIAGYTLTSSLEWTSCNLGKFTILNHPEHEPEYFDNILGTKMVQLPWDIGGGWQAKNISCNIMRSHKNYLFALNLTESGVNYPDMYRWSHPADANGLPFSWDEADTSSLASKEAVGMGQGEILDGLSLRDSFVIYSSNGIDILDFSGDDYVFSRRSLSSTYGILATNCVIEVKGTHYFLTDGDILSNDGTTLSSIIHGKLRKQLSIDLSSPYYKNSYVVKSTANKELWFCVPTKGSIYPNVAYIYNWFTKAWGRRDLPLNTSFACTAAVNKQPLTFDAAIGTIQDQRRTYDSRLTPPTEEVIVSCDNIDSSLKVLEVTDSNNEDYNAFLERTDIAFNGVVSISTLNAIYPHIDGNQVLQIQVGSQDFVNGPILWRPNQDFNPSTDRKLDVRSSGALHCYRISSVRADWTLLGLDFEYSRRGLR